MKGKGARLFAKRQAKSESWAVGSDDVDGDSTTQEQPSANIQQKLSAEHRGPPTADERAPVNRLREMVEVPRAAMSPWEAAAKYGTVDPAFTHLTAAHDSSSTAAAGDTDTGCRVKSWSSDQDAAAAS